MVVKGIELAEFRLEYTIGVLRITFYLLISLAREEASCGAPPFHLKIRCSGAVSEQKRLKQAKVLVLCNTRYFVFMTAYKGALRAP